MTVSLKTKDKSNDTGKTCSDRAARNASSSGTVTPVKGQQAVANLVLQELMGAGAIQAKSAFAPDSDPYEREADQVADQVMLMPASERANVKQSKEQVQTKKTDANYGSNGGLATSSVMRKHAGLGNGKALPSADKEYYESRFGHDFSDVRLHQGNKAAQAANAVNARAYTLGRDIVFGEQQAGSGQESRRLLAHELTHVLQQRSGRKRLQCQNVQMGSGRYVGNLPGPTNNLREEVLQAMEMLRLLGSMTAAEYSEYYDVVQLPANSYVAVAQIPNTIAALTRNRIPTLTAAAARRFFSQGFVGNVGAGQFNWRADIYILQDVLHRAWHLSNPDYATERAAVNMLATLTVPDATIPRTIAGITRLKQSIVAGTFNRDLFAGTHVVTPTEHALVENILIRRTGSVVTPSPVSGAPPIITNPAMTGAGVGGPFESAMLASLSANVGRWASNFRTLRAGVGQPAFPIAQAHGVASAAQRETERYFAPYIRVASRAPADIYHPGGSYSLTSRLGDQSTRPISAGDRRGWTQYWMKRASCAVPPCGQTVLNTFNCMPSDSTRPGDNTEFVRIEQLFSLGAGNQTDIDDAIHGWPAEAGTGTVFIQPYVAAATPTQMRWARWDLFTTLIHEMLHILAHPNFQRTHELIGGTQKIYLREGFADVMRHELWDGPGALRARLASAELAPLRQQVEGAVYPYDPTVIHYHSDYTEYTRARDIAAVVGMENARAAYFLGHTELLGLGHGTTARTALTNVAMWQPTDVTQADIYIVAPGDTLANIQTRTNAPAGGILDATTGAPLGVGATPGAGTRLRIPGIRWVYAIQNDTLGTLAAQHNVTHAALAQANNLPAGTAESHAFAVGSRVLIPIHTVISAMTGETPIDHSTTRSLLWFDYNAATLRQDGSPPRQNSCHCFL